MTDVAAFVKYGDRVLRSLVYIVVSMGEMTSLTEVTVSLKPSSENILLQSKYYYAPIFHIPTKLLVYHYFTLTSCTDEA